MGNPVRYILNGSVLVGRAVVDGERVTFSKIDPIDDFYAEAVIDMYSAPDVLFEYPGSLGETNKNEFLRYYRLTFKNLKLESLVESRAVFSFDEMQHHNTSDSDEMYKNLPLGKFQGMSVDQIKAKKSLLYSQFRFKNDKTRHDH